MEVTTKKRSSASGQIQERVSHFNISCRYSFHPKPLLFIFCRILYTLFNSLLKPELVCLVQAVALLNSLVNKSSFYSTASETLEAYNMFVTFCSLDVEEGIEYVKNIVEKHQKKADFM